MTRNQRGSVAPLLLGGMGAGLVLTLLVSVVGALLVTVRRAQAAADLAALAGATAVQHNGDACAAVHQVARTNGGDPTACEVDGDIVRVTVERNAPPMFGHAITVTARAVAGPQGPA